MRDLAVEKPFSVFSFSEPRRSPFLVSTGDGDAGSARG